MSPDSEEFIDALKSCFSELSNASNAHQMSSYMKGHFAFHGIKSPDRKAIQKPFLDRAYLPPIVDLEEIVKEFWGSGEREYQYFAQELVAKYKSKLTPPFLPMLEFMITHKSWWDTVDMIASTLVGALFAKHPELRDNTLNRWMASDHLWLQRTCLIFQLKYGDKTDREVLASHIAALHEHPDFFIRKAIGWSLRQYAKYEPEWVREFVAHQPMSALSKKEALKHLS